MKIGSVANYWKEAAMQPFSRPQAVRRPWSVLVFCTLTLCLGAVASAQPVISAVVNSASYEAELAPGCWMTIFGNKLAPTPESAPAPEPLPTTLGGVKVSVNGVPAPLAYVSANQINGLIPFEIQVTGSTPKSVAVTVTTSEGASAPHYVLLKPQAPALFTVDQSGKGRVIAISPSFDRLLDSVQPGDYLVLYAAGLGQTDPPAQSDRGGARSEPYNRVPDSKMPPVLVGERAAEVLFAGLAPGWPGIYQLNVRAPDRLESDRVVLQSADAHANITQIQVPAGVNALNVTGTITGLFPSDGTDPQFPPLPSPFDRSVMPQVVRYSVSLDIAPGAKPFSILATGEAGYARIEIDPPSGRWQASLTVLGPDVRNGQYTNVGIIYDYYSCSTGQQGLLCFPFPASMVPRSRMFGSEVLAANQLPLPNATASAGVGIFTASGTLPSTGRFVIDASKDTNSALATFGGLVSIPLGYLETRTAPLRLYVDGKLVASKDISYRVVKRPGQ